MRGLSGEILFVRGGDVMIPTIIHYCWFGGKSLTEKAKACIDSWRRYCPDYEIIEWNESNFDVTQNDYCREAYEAKKWAFVSDYARLWAIYEHGGIYMDTDVEVVRPLDPLLKHKAFMGFEDGTSVSIGTFGADKKNSIIGDCLSAYNTRHFRKVDGSFDMMTNLRLVTDILVRQHGLKLNGKRQCLTGYLEVYPMESFIAKDYRTGWILRDDSTYTVHHYAASWFNEDEKHRIELRRSYLCNYIKRVEPILNKCAGIRMSYELDGYIGVLNRIKDYIKSRL